MFLKIVTLAEGVSVGLFLAVDCQILFYRTIRGLEMEMVLLCMIIAPSEGF